MKKRQMFIIFLGILLMVGQAIAVPTQIIVRVKTKDAKFLGSSMGGALVTIRDADTGEILAKGKTTGSTGNTDLIMKRPKTRGLIISDEKSAKFIATIDIDEPRQIEVTAFGPLAQRQAAGKVSSMQWIVPGKHITAGDAWILELPGFVVDIIHPPTHTKYKGAPQTVKVVANITMM